MALYAAGAAGGAMLRGATSLLTVGLEPTTGEGDERAEERTETEVLVLGSAPGLVTVQPLQSLFVEYRLVKESG